MGREAVGEPAAGPPEPNAPATDDPPPVPAPAVVAAAGTVWRALGGDDLPAAVAVAGGSHGLPSRLPVTTLATATVAAATLAAADLAAARGTPVTAAVTVDTGAVAAAFASERLLRLDGRGFAGFAPLSRFWPAGGAWVRTHANYPHHRARLLAALGIPDDGDTGALVTAVGRRIAATPAEDLAETVTGAGGLAVVVRTAGEWAASPPGLAVASAPLLDLRRVGDAPPVPLSEAPSGPLLPAAGIRVLDLSRVLAGPVGTRSLALLGADVLRVDNPRLPEIEAQHLDTGTGKRSTLLDLDRAADRTRLDELLAGADVVVTGYRPGALDRHGLAPGALLERYPSLVVATLSAWGSSGPWAHRRGFDSLVQAACGIAAVEAHADGRPGALPAQALDHGTGYLLAATVLRALAQRARTGGGWHAELGLARTAHWLMTGLPVTPGHAIAGSDPQRWCAEAAGPVGRVRYALPPIRLPGGPATWAAPATPWGSDEAAWR